MISAVVAGDITVESEPDFLAIHHMIQEGNMVVTPSFLGYSYQAIQTGTRVLILVLINRIYCDVPPVTTCSSTHYEISPQPEGKTQ